MHTGSKVFGKKNRAALAVRAALALGAFGALVPSAVWADVVVKDAATYGGTVTKAAAGSGTQYDITNQQLSADGAAALNRFSQFDLGSADIANLHMGEASHQINIVDAKINIDGVVNALKDNKIAGDVYFMSENGIMVGATGVFNVGRLTLGTNPAFGEALFGQTTSGIKIDANEFYGASAKDRADKMLNFVLKDKGGNISFSGTANAAEAVVAAAGGSLTLDKNAKIYTGATFKDLTNATYTEYRAPLLNTDGLTSATVATVTGGGIALAAAGDVTAKGTLSSDGLAITAKAQKYLTVSDATVKSGGGDIALTVAASEGQMWADPQKTEKGGYLVIKDAYIDSSAADAKAGDIEVTAVRTAMGVARIDVDDSTITAEGKSGKDSGNVTIHATAETNLWNWDIGDGAYAQIKMGKSSKTGNTVIGDNVDIAARSGTKGKLSDKEGSQKKTAAEVEAAIKTDGDEALTDVIGGFAQSFFLVGAASSVKSEAEVEIEKTDLSAVGLAAGAADHGNLSVLSSATSAVETFNIGGAGHGWNVGISKIKSNVNIDNSKLYAQRDMNLSSLGVNTVDLTFKDMSLLTDTFYTGLVVSFGSLKSRVGTTVGQNAVVTAGGNVAATAKAERTFSATTSGFGKVAAAVTVGIVDTRADANIAGKVYAGGDVTSHAETTMSKTGSVYNPDTASAVSATGDSAIAPATDAFSNYAKPLWNRIKGWFGRAGGNEQAQGLSDKWGINGAASVLMTDNSAYANVSGSVRGLSSAKENGRYVGSDAAGAKSLSVTAETVARTSNISGVYQFESTETGPDGEEESKRKEKTVGIAVSYTSQKNHSDAAITGDVKTTGNVAVDAKTKIPWETSYASGDTWDNIKDAMVRAVFGRENEWFYPLVDSWSQVAGKAEDATYAASVVWMNYDNSAKAYIGKADGATSAAKVDAGGDVTVNGTTDVTTVNFTGSIPTILKSSPAMFWKQSKMFNIDGLDPTKAADQGLGGSLLWLKQKNTTEAYIDDGATVTATKGKTNVEAKTNALNLGITTAGGAAKSVAFDASLGLNGIDNTTKARIENADITAASLALSATDMSRNINLAGGVGISGAKGIGASIAYTNISRTTDAILSGKLTITGDTDVTAKNTGSIVAVSVAGAVTYDAPQDNIDNDAGSVGLHFADEEGNDQAMELEDIYNDFDGSEGGEGSVLDRSEHAFEEMAGNDAIGQDEVAQAKKSWAVAANLSLNNISDTARAHVTKKATGNTTISADALRVNAGNDSLIFAGSGTVAADTTEEKGNAIAGSFMYNAVKSTNEAYVDGAELTLVGTKKKDDKDKVIDEALTVAAKNAETITNIAASGSGTSKGNAAAGQISLNLIDNTVKAHVKDAAVSADKAMAIRAEDAGTVNSYTGAFAVAKDDEGKAAGASIDVNIIKGNTESFAENTSFGKTATGEAAGSLSVTAEEASDLTAITASAAGAGKLAGGFSISGSSLDNTVKAYITGNKALDIGALSVAAGNHGTSTVGVGALGVSKNSAVGASLAVMVNHSTVTAYAAGDEKKTTAWKTKGLSITADNAYNGSASDSEDDSKAKVVAVGAAGGKDLFAGSGSVTVSHVKQTTDAYLGKGKYDTQDGDVTIKAQNKANLFGMAGGLSVSKGTGIGAAVDVQKYIGHTYAGIKSGTFLSNATKTDVTADSSEKLTSIAAAAGIGLQKGGGAGAAGAHDVTTDTKAYVGEDEENAEETYLEDAGNTKIAASDVTTLSTGSGAAGASAEGKVGAGLSAAVEVIDKTAQAFVGKNTDISDTTTSKVSSLTVEATNTGNFTTAAAALGVTGGEGLGVAGSASETFVNFKTNAYIGDASVNVNGDTTVRANSSFTQGAGAGGLGGSASGGVGLTNSTVSFTGTTKAYLADKAWVIAAGKVDVAAAHTTNLTYATVAGGIGGQFGVAGTVGANVLHTTTHAYTGQSAYVAAKDVSLSATDDTTFSGGNGGAGVGLGGGGGGVALAVAKVVKDTEAYAGHGATLRATGGNVSLAAKNTENWTNISVQGGGGSSIGIAGAVNVNYLNAITKAYTESNVEIDAEKGNVSLDATHEVSKWMSGVYGAAISGGVSVGAAIDVGVLRTQTNAYFGAANVVKAAENVSVTAKEHMKNMLTNAVAAGIGDVGVSGSISVYSFGNTLSDSDKALTSGKAKKDGQTVTLETWLNEAMNQSDVGTAMGTYKHSAFGTIKEKTKEKVSADAPEMAGEKGTLAAVGAATDVDAKNITVTSDDNIAMKNGMGNGSGSATFSAGASVSVVNMETETQTKVGDWASLDATKDITVKAASTHTMTNVTVGASGAGVASLQGTEETWNDKSDVRTMIGNNVRIATFSDGKIGIGTTNTRVFDSTLVGASAALYGAANGAVITASIEGSAETTVGSGSTVGGAYNEEKKATETPTVDISSKADTKLVAGAVGASLGMFTGTGTGVSLASDVTAKTKIDANAVISGNAISVTAENTPILKATATAASAGAGAVGITVAKTVSKDKALVDVGDGVRFYASDALKLQAAMKKPEDTNFKNSYANTIAGAGGVVAGAVAFSSVTLDQKTGVDIGKSAQLYGKTVTISSDHKDSEDIGMNSVGAGMASGTGGQLRMDITSDSHVKVGDGTVISSQGETSIAAHNESERNPENSRTSLSVGASLVGGTGIDSETDITHNTSVDLGKVVMAANATLTDEETKKGLTPYDKKAIAVEATSKIISKEDHDIYGGSFFVAMAGIRNKTTATANTSVNVADGASFAAGDTASANATGKQEDYAGTDAKTYDASYRGGSIGVGTRNDADISSRTTVDVFGLVGAAGSTNDVTYNNHLKTTFGATAETAKGDISVGSGRDAKGEAGEVTAWAHSDLLSASAVPITDREDPFAKITGDAKLTISAAADLRSDRDIYLRANKGDLTAKASGETKSWTSAIRDAFASGNTVGKREVSVTADTEMNGKAETGIHRNKTITVGGRVGTDGKWITTVTSDGDISYTYGVSKPVDSDLFTRYDELKQLLQDYGGGAAAKAAYEAELAFLEEKMVEEGLGYFETLTDGSKRFIRMAYSGSSELADAKAMAIFNETNREKFLADMNSKLDATDAQITQFAQVEAQKTVYDNAVSALLKAQVEAKEQNQKYNQLATAIDQAAQKENLSPDAYISQYSDSELVKKYNESRANWESAQTAETAATQTMAKVKSDFAELLAAYNNAYDRDFVGDPEKVSSAELESENQLLDAQKSDCENRISTYLQNIEKLGNQISATEAFFQNGGTEDGNGVFWYRGTKCVVVSGNGDYVPEGTDGAYYLLHKNEYRQMTHDVTIGEITAQLGDILFEGDNVYGSGTLSAPTDATVTVTNNSPNQLVVGDIKIVGRGGTTGTDQGGNVYYNGKQLKATDKTVADQIKAINKDATKTVSFTTKTAADTKAPAVSVTNEFRPSAYRDDDGAPIYMASGVTLSGYIYNPRGSVHVTSDYGDVANHGHIYAGSVKIDVKNGDYIQVADLDKNGSITSVGGNPMNTDGSKATLDDTGIQANGNIFISARYLNINSKIQSGTAAKTVEIPAAYKIYYMDGSEKHFVTEITDEVKGKTLLVADAAGNGIDGISYDWETDRFVVADAEIRGGHISLVGTILNTTNDTSKAKIEALDGYGGITVKNHSDKDLEIQSLSTGEGKQGKIEITDLDRSTGNITRKTTYTRENGQIVMSVQKYASGAPSGDPEVTHYEENAGVYKPASGSYYNYQIGQDKSVTYTYEINDTRMDWWGIADKEPTAEEMLNKGATEKVVYGESKTLNGGAFVSDSNNVGTIKQAGDAYQVFTTTNKGDKTTVKFEKTSTRLWYTIWLAKKYNYKLTQKSYDTDVTQYSMKADYDIGIGFMGQANGGTIDVDGGSKNVYLNGMVQNGAGETSLAGQNIIRQSTSGYIKTGSLKLDATGNAGTKDALIRTDATEISGTAGQNFGVDVLGGSVNVGNITAGETAVVQAKDGDLIQKAGATMTANRVELVSGGVIRGTDAEGKPVSFTVSTGQQEGADYGLKASAYGDIDIENTSGDLYIDSVISEKGAVNLKTNGSFLDNNFTDYTDESAKEKLLHWANEAILEGEGTTIQKQKDLLTAKVYGKYGEFVGLSAFVKDGAYTLDAATTEAMKNSGMTDADIASYVAERQKRYDELVAAGVDKWTKDGVEAYVKSIEDSTDTTLYGNASLAADALSGDDFLTKDEKAACLVGSATSAKSLLITFTPGGIKEGITDTNTSFKETPHVSGASITMTALGKDGADHSGNIGEKKTGMTIDMSDPTKLTAAELLALSAAERGDFKIDGNIVTVSSVRPIDAETTGVMKALAEKGAIYLVGLSGFTEGSTFFGDDEVRLKTSGDLVGITAGSKAQLVLESGDGAIKNVNVTGRGVLTARAKDGVTLSKEDGDLIINTVYASEGDVSLNLNGKGRLLAVEGNDDESEGAETGTTYVNIEGENITISGAKNIEGQHTDAATANTNSVGMKVTGTKAADGTVTPGKISAETEGRADITLFGDTASEETKISATDLTLTNRGTITEGAFTGNNSLSVYNTKDATIEGGTFTGGDEDSATETSGLTLTNQGAIKDVDFTALSGNLTIANTGTLRGGEMGAAQGSVSVTNDGEGATIDGSTFAARDNVTYMGTNGATGKDLTASATDGPVTMTADTDLSVKRLSAGSGDSQVESQGAVQLTDATTAGNLTLKAGTTLNATTVKTTEGNLTIQSGSDATIGTATVAGNMTASSEGKLNITTATTTEGDMTLTSGDAMTLGNITSANNLTANSGATLDAENLDVTGAADLDSKGNLTVKKLTAGSADVDSEADAKLDDATIEGNLDVKADKNISIGTAAAKDASFDAGEKLNITTATTTEGDMSLTSGDAMTLGNITSGKNLTANSGATLDAENLDVTGAADLDSKGNLTVKKLTAGSADVDSEADAKLDDATIEENLDVKADKNISIGNATAKEASFDAGETLHVTTVTTTEGDLTIQSGSDATIGTATAAQKMNVSSDKNISIESATAKDADVQAGETLSIRKLATENDATLSSGDSMTVLESDIGKTLSMNAGKDIVVHRSESVTLDMQAKGSISSEGANASISADSATMTAGEDIRLTDKENVKKLDGVDTSEPASKPTGVGQSGSIFFGNAEPKGFDVGQKGSTVLSVKKNLQLSGKTVEADTVKADSHVDITADNLGIDDLQSDAKELTVSIRGQDGNQAHYAGIHTTSSGAVTIQNSAIEHLDFTGIDDIGLSNSALGGSSTMQTNRVYFSLRKNPANGMAEWIGTLRLKGIGIETDVPFTRVDDGILINGDSADSTAHATMNRSLYGLRGLGKDGAEKEEKEETTVSGAIRFGSVSETESYHSVNPAQR